MNRRQLLKTGVLAGGMYAFPGAMAFGGNIPEKGVVENAGHIKARLGELEIFLFSDGHITLKNPQPVFAPGVDPEEVRKELKRVFLKEDRLESAINVMVIKTGERLILIDTGSGYHFGETGGQLLHNLKNAGIAPRDVTDVFITHAHVDHIGGIVDNEGKMVYPDAKYYIAQKEYDFWTSEKPDFSKSKNPENPGESVKLAKQVFRAIEDKLIKFDYGETLFSCITPELAEGHTPGHTVFTVFSGDKNIKHIVDTVHTPLLVGRPEWGTQWDVDFTQGVKARKLILEDNYRKGTLVMTTHLPWPGLGYIGKNGNDYQWVPFPYFTPNEIIL